MIDVTNFLNELRQEREMLEDIIVNLERIAGRSGGNRRGRPPAWLAEARARQPERLGASSRIKSKKLKTVPVTET